MLHPRGRKLNKDNFLESCNARGSDSIDSVCTSRGTSNLITHASKIARLEKDLLYLRLKAEEASSEKERAARWNLVRELENQLDSMLMNLDSSNTKLEKDLAHLIIKAEEASSEEERIARWTLVKDFERQVKVMMDQQ